MKGVTRSGFAFDIPDETLDDMELLEAIAGIEADVTALPRVVVAILGDRKKALYDHVRQGHGRVSVTAVSEEIAQILSSTGSLGKN